MPDPTRSSIFQEGVDARARGQDVADNPYCVPTEDHTEWNAGWRATFDLDEETDPASDRDQPEVLPDEPDPEPPR